MLIRTSGDEAVAVLLQAVGHRLGVAQDLHHKSDTVRRTVACQSACWTESPASASPCLQQLAGKLARDQEISDSPASADFRSAESQHLLLVLLELGGSGLLQRAREAADGVVVGATLQRRDDVN